MVMDQQVDRPSGSVALADPQTGVALGQYRSSAVRAALLGLALIIAAAVIVNTAPKANPTGVAAVATNLGFAFGFVLLILGLGGLFRSVRMKRTLRRQPWVLRHACYRIAPIGQGQPALILRADADHPEAVCSIAATARRSRKLNQGTNEPVLVVGDPLGRWAVASPLDRQILLVIKHPIFPWWVRRLRRIAKVGAPDLD